MDTETHGRFRDALAAAANRAPQSPRFTGTINAMATLGALTIEGDRCFIGSRLTIYEQENAWKVYFGLLLFTVIGAADSFLGSLRTVFSGEQPLKEASSWTEQDLSLVESNLSRICVCTTGGLGLSAEFSLRNGEVSAGFGDHKPADVTIWPDVGYGVSDTDVQRFWADASKKYAYSSEWDESLVKGVVAIALKGGGAIDHDIAVAIERSAQVTHNEVVHSLAAEIRRNGPQFPASFGAVGLLLPLGSPGTRPGFSLLISGPHGGSEAVRVFLHAFQKRGISGPLARQIEEDRYGIIRGLFLPEWLCYFGDRNAGIDWNVWKVLASSDFERHFYEAMLAWSDEILKTLRHLQQRAGLMIEGIRLDSYSAIALLDTDETTAQNEISRLNEPANFSAAEVCARYVKKCL